MSPRSLTGPLIAFEPSADTAKRRSGLFIRLRRGALPVETDGKQRADFDMIDSFIADYAIRLENAEAVCKMDSLELARKLKRDQQITIHTVGVGTATGARIPAYRPAPPANAASSGCAAPR